MIRTADDSVISTADDNATSDADGSGDIGADDNVIVSMGSNEEGTADKLELVL